MRYIATSKTFLLTYVLTLQEFLLLKGRLHTHSLMRNSSTQLSWINLNFVFIKSNLIELRNHTILCCINQLHSLKSASTKMNLAGTVLTVKM